MCLAGRIIPRVSIVIKILGAPKSVSDPILIPDNIIYIRIGIYLFSRLANVIVSERRQAHHRWSHTVTHQRPLCPSPDIVDESVNQSDISLFDAAKQLANRSQVITLVA